MSNYKLSLTESEKEFLRMNHNRMSLHSLAKHTHRSVYKVREFLQDENLPLAYGHYTHRRGPEKEVAFKEGMFNVREKENWLL